MTATEVIPDQQQDRDDEIPPPVLYRRRYSIDVSHSTGFAMFYLTVIVWLVMVGLVAIFQPAVFLQIMGRR